AASASSHHCPHSRRPHRNPRRLLVRSVAWALVFDGWPDAGIGGGLRGRSVARRALRAASGEPGRLAQARVHRGSRGRHSVLRHLLASGTSEGHHVLSLRSQSHAVLGVRGRFHARPSPQHVGALGTGGSYGIGRLYSPDVDHGTVRGDRAPALLLPQPPRRMVPSQTSPARSRLTPTSGATSRVTGWFGEFTATLETRANAVRFPRRAA